MLNKTSLIKPICVLMLAATCLIAANIWYLGWHARAVAEFKDGFDVAEHIDVLSHSASDLLREKGGLIRSNGDWSEVDSRIVTTLGEINNYANQLTLLSQTDWATSADALEFYGNGQNILDEVNGYASYIESRIGTPTDGGPMGGPPMGGPPQTNLAEDQLFERLRGLEGLYQNSYLAAQQEYSYYKIAAPFASFVVLCALGFVLFIPVIKSSAYRANFASDLIEEIHQGIVIYNADDKVVFASKRVGELLEMEPNWNPLGLSRKQMVELAATRGDYGEKPDLDHLCAEATFASLESDHRDRLTPSGKLVRLNFKNVRDHKIVTYTDITDLKRREDALVEAAESQRKLSLLAENTLDMITTYDKDFNVTWVNSAFEKHTGYRLGEIIGNPSIDLAQAKTPDGTSLLAHVSEGNAYRGEIIRHKNNGEPYWCDISLQPIYGDRGELVQFICVNRDISEEVIDRGKLLERERAADRLARALDNANDAIAIIDIEGTCTWANKAFLQASIYGKETIGKQVWKMLEGPESDYRTILAIRQALATGSTFKQETLAYRQNGARYWVELACGPIENAGEEANEFVYVQRDITTNKEKELQIEKARLEAETANSAKSEFLANMSHEIRTPMNGIIGMSEILLDTELSREQQAQVSTIVQSGETLLTIINDILDFSKIESGKFELQRAPFNLKEIVADIVQLVSSQRNKNDLDIQFDYQQELNKDFIGDAVRIRQVVTNIIGNAIKFTSEGSVHVSVTGAKDAKTNHSKLEIKVADTGIGIPKNQLGKIFSAFEQADSSTARRFGGTGLGLAISKRFIELMGGDISVESLMGAGSTFTIELSLPHANQEISVDESLRSSIQFDALNLDLEILVAEDNKTNQLVLKKMLQHLGLKNIRTCNNGAQAISAYKDKQPDLILMDWFMPEMDGLEATGKIRDLEAANDMAHCPIVALTASAMQGDEEKCLAAGMDAYITKPIDKTKLAETIVRLTEVKEAVAH